MVDPVIVGDSFGMGDGALVGIALLASAAVCVAIVRWFVALSERVLAMQDRDWEVKSGGVSADENVANAMGSCGVCGAPGCCCGSNLADLSVKIEAATDAIANLGCYSCVQVDDRRWWQKLTARIWPAVHAKRPVPEFRSRDCVTVRYVTVFTWWDVAKLLLSRRIDVQMRVVTENEVGNTKSAVACEVLPPSFIRKAR